jgi:hypothetical protein
MFTAESNIDYRGRGLFLPTTAAEANSSWFAGVPYAGSGFQIGSSSSHAYQSATGPYVLANAKLHINPTGQVGIGVAPASYKLHVVDATTSARAIFADATATSGTTYALYGQNASTGGIGVFGDATTASGSTYGVYGRSASSSGAGLYGRATAGGGMGTLSIADGPSGIGVYGLATNTGATTTYGVLGVNNGAGFGVYGQALKTTGTTFGVYGLSASNAGIGLYGHASSTTGSNYGVIGYTPSTAGIGIYAQAAATTGNTVGMYGVNNSTAGIGVYGLALATTGSTYGVYGYNASSSGYGVIGYNSASSGTTFGVFGISNSASGYDFYAGGVGIDYGSSSSKRWKNNVQTIPNALGKLAQLRGVYFDWDEKHGAGRHDIGFIAEEVGKVVPEIVQYEADGSGFAIGMDYSKMTPLLLQALKDLKMEKDDMEDELGVLRIANQQLSESVMSFEARLKAVEKGGVASPTGMR